MTHPAFDLDWNLVRTFVAVAQEGSLAAGARYIGITHPTAARHVQALEDELGVGLFSRTSKGLVLNDLGKRLLKSARAMHESALAFRSARDQFTSQPVTKLTISVAGVLAELLPEVLLDQLISNPSFNVDIVVTDDILNLLEHDADIAIRHVQPTQQELLCRRVGQLAMSTYATQAYLDRFGPLDLENLSEHRFVDGLARDHLVRAAHKQGIQIDAEQVVCRSDSIACRRAAVCAGCGIGAFPQWMASRHPEWIEVGDRSRIVDMEVWVAARPGVRDSAQLRSIFSELGQALAARLSD